MRTQEQKQAKELRRQGHSVRSIAAITGCAKGSVSRWVRDIALADEQIEKLRSNQDRGRALAAQHPNSPRQVWARIRLQAATAAKSQIAESCSEDTLKILGAGLYWAEGYKAGDTQVNFSNADPTMIRLMMRFFRKICQVPESKFRGIVHIHPHQDAEKARSFWSEVSGIPQSQFHRTQFAVSRAGQQKRDTLPLGTFRIVISDTRLQCNIKGWIEGLKGWGLGANSSVG